TPVVPTPPVEPTTPVVPTPPVEPTTPVVPTPPVEPTTPVIPSPPVSPATTVPLGSPRVPVQSEPLKVVVAEGTEVAVLPSTGEADSALILIMSGGVIIASLSLAGVAIRRND
ncbi:TPA: LPXTG cell wall anchor domain-containing protein, partial [Streptococcus suis]